MRGRTSLLQALRRRTASVGRVVLAGFVLAAASAQAAPCLAMPSAIPPQHDDGASAHAAHEHSPAAPHQARAAPDQHEHSRAAPHSHSTPSDPPDRPEARSPCAHCPPAVAMEGHGPASAHAFCSAAGDVSDGGKPSSPPTVFKTIVSTPIVEVLPFDRGPRLAFERRRPPDAAAASVALNLRHCVFLI